MFDTCRFRRSVAMLFAAAAVCLAGTETAHGEISFACDPQRLTRIGAEVAGYLAELEIPPALYTVAVERGRLVFALATPADDDATLDFAQRPEFGIPVHIDWMPTAEGEPRNVLTVTHKEIVLALMQHGRLTEFAGAACDVDALREHVGLRQNIVAWAEALHWGWPEGGPARWNRKYWRAGSLKTQDSLRRAVNDAFLNQHEYEIGCYTATKLVVVQGILDYFHRVRPDAAKAALVEARLLADREPLVDIEPGRMWSFEPDFDPAELDRPGKLLRIAYGIAPLNFVPGDWAYIVNTDPTTRARTGYEGSNPIYLGRNRFVDYYDAHDHFYTYEEKLDDVYQWRHRVFNRSRDAHRIVPLAPADYERLGRPPDEGGMVVPMRVSPYYFGFESLPEMPRGGE